MRNGLKMNTEMKMMKAKPCTVCVKSDVCKNMKTVMNIDLDVVPIPNYVYLEEHCENFKAIKLKPINATFGVQYEGQAIAASLYSDELCVKTSESNCKQCC